MNRYVLPLTIGYSYLYCSNIYDMIIYIQITNNIMFYKYYKYPIISFGFLNILFSLKFKYCDNT